MTIDDLDENQNNELYAIIYNDNGTIIADGSCPVYTGNMERGGHISTASFKLSGKEPASYCVVKFLKNGESIDELELHI